MEPAIKNGNPALGARFANIVNQTRGDGIGLGIHLNKKCVYAQEVALIDHRQNPKLVQHGRCQQQLGTGWNCWCVGTTRKYMFGNLP